MQSCKGFAWIRRSHMLYLLAAVLVIYIVLYQMDWFPTSIFYDYPRCIPKPDDPVLFRLKTRLKVFYDAGQWFHMAENYLVQHTLLGEQGKLTSAKVVYYNFDKGDFKKNLNGFTRLIIYLGTVLPNSYTQSLHFLDDKVLASMSLTVGDGILLPTSLQRQRQSIDVNPSMSTLERFLYQLSSSPSLRQQPTTTASGNQSSSNRRREDESTLWNSNSSSSIGNNRQGETMYTKSSVLLALAASVPSSPICVRYLDTIGSTLIPREAWFPRRRDIHTLRQKIIEACPRNETLLKEYHRSFLVEDDSKKMKKQYRLVIYQRDQTRRILRIETAIQYLTHYLPSPHLWSIEILLHDNTRSPCTLAHYLSTVDILITPHGFQSMLLLFLPIPSLLLEIFPSPYEKIVYQTLAQNLGIYYEKLMSPIVDPTLRSLIHSDQSSSWSVLTAEKCNAIYFCRAYARNQDVLFTEKMAQEAIVMIVKHMSLFNEHPEYREIEEENQVRWEKERQEKKEKDKKEDAKRWFKKSEKRKKDKKKTKGSKDGKKLSKGRKRYSSRKSSNSSSNSSRNNSDHNKNRLRCGNNIITQVQEDDNGEEEEDRDEGARDDSVEDDEEEKELFLLPIYQPTNRDYLYPLTIITTTTTANKIMTTTATKTITNKTIHKEITETSTLTSSSSASSLSSSTSLPLLLSASTSSSSSLKSRKKNSSKVNANSNGRLVTIMNESYLINNDNTSTISNSSSVSHSNSSSWVDSMLTTMQRSEGMMKATTTIALKARLRNDNNSSVLISSSRSMLLQGRRKMMKKKKKNNKNGLGLDMHYRVNEKEDDEG